MVHNPNCMVLITMIKYSSSQEVGDHVYKYLLLVVSNTRRRLYDICVIIFPCCIVNDTYYKICNFPQVSNHQYSVDS